MDEVRIQNSFIRGIVSKFLNSAIRKSLGCDMKTRLNELNAKFGEKDVHVHLNMDFDMTPEQFKMLLTKFGVG